MKTLNLVRHLDQIQISKYPGGEICLPVLSFPTYDPDCEYKVKYFASILSSDDLVLLLLDVASLRQHPSIILDKLYIGYLPYGRQDRYDGVHPFNLKVICELLDNLGFRSIDMLDPHSNIALACFNKTRAIGSNIFFGPMDIDREKIAWVAPDLGALKKQTTHFYDYPHIVCNKVRDPKTGCLMLDVTEFSVPKSVKEYIIFDDICDGGATFIAAANAIKKKRKGMKANLCVTHGIFSKGTKQLFEIFDNIYTTDTIPQKDKNVNVTSWKNLFWTDSPYEL